jgi:peptidoglycan/xylan/chitin deacetylase (PgdA/CDA1 family)
MARASVHILTWHSISDGAGPTAISPSVFDEQIAAIAESGALVWTFDDYLAWRDNPEGAPNAVIVTFDDAFEDYLSCAHPVLMRRKMRATMFAPAAHIGRKAQWDGADGRMIMDWPDLAAAARDGLIVGSHGSMHVDLTRLSEQRLKEEIDRAADLIAERIGAPATYFAAPFGRTNRKVEAAASRWHRAAAGVSMAIAGAKSPLYDLPRIDMHYYRNARLIEAFLRGERAYFTIRRTARGARFLASSLLGAPPT